MNKRLFLMSVAAASSVFAVAQDYTDALRFNRNDVTGTARTQAMAGAFGAVGADLTSMAINPAGMAVYRATELGLSLGVNVIKDESEYYKTKASDDRVRVPFNQIGVSFSIGRMRENGGGLINSSLFVGYNRLADFSSRQAYSDPYSYNSLLDYFCLNEQKTASMTGDLAYNAYLTNDTTNSSVSSFTYNIWEQFVGDGVNPNFRQDEQGLGLINLRKKVKEDGSKGDISIGYAANISNKVYVGGSINIQTLNYENTTTHTENFEGYLVNSSDPASFAYQTYLDQDGTGVCFNLGAIYRPVNFIRVGFALHSPTFFSINERYSAQIYNPARNLVKEFQGETEYRFRTPSRFIASVAGVIGKGGMISVDFERTNNTRSKFREKDEDDDDFLSSDPFESVNSQMKNNILKASNTLRIGGELSILNPFYIRAGYKFSTPGVKRDYYVNKPKDYAYSGGIGFRLNNFFADLAYVCAVKKADHWVLPDSAEGYTYETNTPAYLTHKVHSGVITIGVRF